MTRAIFTSAANRDVQRALDYYKRDAGVKVADDFIDHLESKVARILRSPEFYRVVTKTSVVPILIVSRIRSFIELLLDR